MWYVVVWMNNALVDVLYAVTEDRDSKNANAAMQMVDEI